MDVQLGTLSENARIGDCYRCAKFHACIKKCTICLKFRAMPPDYFPTELVSISFRQGFKTINNSAFQSGLGNRVDLNPCWCWVEILHFAAGWLSILEYSPGHSLLISNCFLLPDNLEY